MSTDDGEQRDGRNAESVEEDLLSSGQHRPYSEIRYQLLVLGLFPLSEHIAWTSIFPYIYHMVESFSSARSSPEKGENVVDSNTATYAGILVSVFTFGEFIMAPNWARLSDKIGRKPTLLVGSIGAMISATVFGFSSNLPAAIGARTFAGLANPNLGVVQTFVGELVDKKDQAKGFAVVSFLRGLGSITGPIVGGYLAEPVQHYPGLFRPKSIWDQFPYLLPNLMVVGCLVTSCILCFLFLEEVHLDLRSRTDLGRSISGGVLNLLRGKSWSEKGQNKGEYVPVDAPVDAIELISPTETVSEDPKSRTLDRRKAFTRQVCLQILSSTIQGYLSIATLALVPIFLGTPSSSSGGMTGGLGLNTQGTSNVLLSQALAAILSQLFAIPRIIERWGPLLSLRVALFLIMCIYIVIPASAALPPAGGIAMTAAALWMYALVNGLKSTCTSILVTNTAPAPVYLATINGAAASLGCLARTLGPIISGPLFRLGLKMGFVALPFWALAGVSGLGLTVAMFLQDHP